ncbi:MAG: NusG domain II-containing protein [Spirochaetaceae bacterium]|nr:NusG domain II-containing protein [Spirochaetaceae bacterium]
MYNIKFFILDYVFFVSALAACAALAFFVYTGAKGANAVVQGEDGRWVYPLEAENLLRVRGPIGETLVEVHAGSARVLSSPCENQSCVAQGAVHSGGGWIACLPNRVIVSIESAANTADSSQKNRPPDAAVW